MMTRDELNKYLCAIITTLAEVPNAPESTLYMAVGMNMEKWNLIKQVLVTGNLATFHGYQVTLTAAGHAMAAKINAALAGRQ